MPPMLPGAPQPPQTDAIDRFFTSLVANGTDPAALRDDLSALVVASTYPASKDAVREKLAAEAADQRRPDRAP